MSDYSERRRIMVDTQVRPSDVTSFPIIEAMLEVPREMFVPRGQRAAAYLGETLDLGDGAFLLEPRTFAKMLEALNLSPGDLVLDLGAGLGYSSAVMARLAEAVIAVEAQEARATEAQALLGEAGADSVCVTEGPLAEGAAQHGPYDAIVIEGGIEHLPEALAAQLKDGGRIVALFMERALGTVRLGRKQGGVIYWRDVFHASAPVLEGFTRVPAFEF